MNPQSICHVDDRFGVVCNLEKQRTVQPWRKALASANLDLHHLGGLESVDQRSNPMVGWWGDSIV